MRKLVRRKSVMMAGVLALAPAATLRAATVPFTEEFADSPAGWIDATDAVSLDWAPSGGPDGSSFATTSFNFAGQGPGAPVVLFRAEHDFNSSGGAFEGNWIDEEVSSFSAWVKHDYGQPLNFFTRFSSPDNYPGATALDITPVPSDAWTLISFAIAPDSGQFISFEGTDFEAVFSEIGQVQVGVSVPSGLAGLDQPITFGIDKPTIVPEPRMLVVFATAACGVGMLRRRPLPVSDATSAGAMACGADPDCFRDGVRA